MDSAKEIITPQEAEVILDAALGAAVFHHEMRDDCLAEANRLVARSQDLLDDADKAHNKFVVWMSFLNRAIPDWAILRPQTAEQLFSHIKEADDAQR